MLRYRVICYEEGDAPGGWEEGEGFTELELALDRVEGELRKPQWDCVDLVDIEQLDGSTVLSSWYRYGDRNKPIRWFRRSAKSEISEFVAPGETPWRDVLQTQATPPELADERRQLLGAQRAESCVSCNLRAVHVEADQRAADVVASYNAVNAELVDLKARLVNGALRAAVDELLRVVVESSGRPDIIRHAAIDVAQALRAF